MLHTLLPLLLGTLICLLVCFLLGFPLWWVIVYGVLSFLLGRILSTTQKTRIGWVLVTIGILGLSWAYIYYMSLSCISIFGNCPLTDTMSPDFHTRATLSGNTITVQVLPKTGGTVSETGGQ